ncbi:MAG: hypothetical protein ACOCZ6_04115 [Nanoarchaeota archaeon]
MVEGLKRLGVYNSQTLGLGYKISPGSECKPGLDLFTSLYATTNDVIK